MHVVPRPAPPLTPPSVSDAALARVTRIVALSVFAGALAYAIVRYVVIGPVAPAHIPLFVLNKAAAFAGAALLAATVALGPLCRRSPRLAPWKGLRKGLGCAGFGFSAVHTVATLALLDPAYYAKLYLADGRLGLRGELAVLLGVAALALLVLPAATSFTGIRRAMSPGSWGRVQRLALGALAAAGLHVAVLGWPTWLAPATWPGDLPPITLLAAALIAGALALRFRPRR